MAKNNRETGTITMIRPELKYGFISPDTGLADVFFHYNQLATEYDRPFKGDKVSYRLTEAKQGPAAKNVKRINDENDNFNST